eukprot:NODE_170_length_14437_cov_1.447273.p1 type:complete len:562 gc:universal NODE_170_length_14437_cov_1.447273:11366-9681(-)
MLLNKSKIMMNNCGCNKTLSLQIFFLKLKILLQFSYAARNFLISTSWLTGKFSKVAHKSKPSRSNILRLCDWALGKIICQKPSYVHNVMIWFLSAVLSTSKIGQSLNQTKIVGYYQPREGGVQLSDIDFTKLTHLLYAFATVYLDGTVTFNGPGSDMDWESWATSVDVPSDPAASQCSCGSTCLKGYLNQLWEVKRDNPSLRTVLSIGGWAWSHNFSAVMKSSDTRQKMIQGATNMMTTYGFDGIDIDWEFPAALWRSDSEKTYTSDANDFQNLASFLKETRAYWKSQNLPDDTILSVAMPPHLQQLKSGKAVLGQLNTYCSFVMLMSYEFQHNDQITRLGAPLYSRPDDSSDERTKNIDLGFADYVGIDPKKLIMGVPLYATGFTNFKTGTERSGGMKCLGATLNAKKDIELIAVDYKTMISMTTSNGFSGYNYDSKRGTSSACNGTHFYSFDTVESAKQKAQYVISKGYGGIMLWDLSQDIGEKEDSTKSIYGAVKSGLNAQVIGDRNFTDICLQESDYCNLKCDYTPEVAQQTKQNFKKNSSASTINAVLVTMILLIH